MDTLEPAVAAVSFRVSPSSGGAVHDRQLFDSYLYECVCRARRIRFGGSRRCFAGICQTIPSRVVSRNCGKSFRPQEMILTYDARVQRARYLKTIHTFAREILQFYEGICAAQYGIHAQLMKALRSSQPAAA